MEHQEARASGGELLGVELKRRVSDETRLPRFILHGQNL
ncbi:hypothetical protein T190_16410 [Sinorhizobium meliloti CCBAU 01290]|nr:hypothetical protein T190_16410 [Sinorhizobium meliloti CCBAU 01290]